MHPNTLRLFDTHIAGRIKPGDRVLEVGPDNIPSSFRNHMHGGAVWEAVDTRARPGLTYVAIGDYEWPINDETFDVVVSGHVLEHVAKPWRWMTEAARVTNPGGMVATIAAVSWPYQDVPIDYWRIYPEGMKALHEEAGLETVLAEWGSLETPQPRRVIPGRSERDLPEKLRWYSKVAGPIGLPVERAFDTVAIATKPA